MSSIPAVYLVGATGLTGYQTFLYVLSSPSLFSSLTTITRRPLSAPPSDSSSSASTPHTNLIFNFQDPSTWSFSSPTSTASAPGTKKVFVSCLGTQKAIVGSVEEQRKVDYDLNLALAKAAKEQGVETYILVSAAGADPSSYFLYPKMKGEIEQSILALSFPTTHFLQPGLLVGDRDGAGGMEVLVKGVFKGLRWLGVPGLGKMGVGSELVGKAIASLASRKSQEEGVHYYSNQQIVDLGTAYDKPA
ncbi:hypothetical protein BDY24DRAFT_403970 [Mrakia frigida]|uniref:Fmp52p n=1 Tax=Mrakia frigida TaxID=29902 RepID=UPI003FCBF264